MLEANIHCLQILGKLTFQPSDPPLPMGTYIIQRVPAGTGNVTADPTGSLQIRRHVVGIDPNTPAQQANRAKVRTAVAQWHTLDAAAKTTWRERGHARRISGFNAYLSAALRAPSEPAGTAWDGGAARWDAAATTWDIQRGQQWDDANTFWDGGATAWE